ncbi:MAG: RNA methyltransferase [Clostridiaceae bacterium]|jgi:TrmH family RNA methyltransferase|nr:RNA methyltransferase [Clostridiaceae bacterium]
MIITSVSNDKIRFLRKLKDKKHRAETGLTLVEGGNAVRDLPNLVTVEYVAVTVERESEFTGAVSEKFKNAEILTVSQNVMDALSDTETPYGIIAAVRTAFAPFALPTGNALLLDGVSDAGNLGTVLRTAAACGFDDVYLLNTADVFSPKTIRASMGAVFQLKIRDITLNEAVKLLQKTESAALDMGGKSLFDTVFGGAVTLVLGAEAHGVSSEVLSACKYTVSLPMKRMESLNAGVAAGVAMYEVSRRA